MRRRKFEGQTLSIWVPGTLDGAASAFTATTWKGTPSTGSG